MNVVIALLLLIVCLVIGVPVALCFLVSAAFLSFVNGSNPIMLISYGFKSINRAIAHHSTVRLGGFPDQ